MGPATGGKARRLRSLLVLPLALAGVPAVAQIADPYRNSQPTTIDAGLGTAAIDVAERVRPEFDPVGGRLGSFFLFPTFDITAQYQDNIFGTDRNKIGDLFITPRVGATLESRWSRHRLTVDGFALANRFVSLQSQNSEGYGGHVGGQLDIDHETRALIDLNYESNPEDRLSINGQTGSRRPIIYRTLQGSARVDKAFGRFVATARAQHIQLDYENGRTADGINFSQQYRNLNREIFTGVLQYKAQGGIAVIAAASYDTLDYPTLSFINRDSTGYRVEGGVGLELTNLLSGEVRVGYLHRSYDDPNIRSPSGVSFFANVLWNATPTLSIRLNANRDIDQTGSTIVAGNLRSEFRLSAAWELRRNIILYPLLRYSHINPVGLSGSNDEYDGRLRAAYLINRRYRFTAEVGHFKRTAGQYPRANANTALIGFGIRL